MLLADLFNGFLYQISNLVGSGTRVFGLVATLIPGVAFIVGACIYTAVAPFTLWDGVELGERIALLATSVSTIVGLTLYLIADNFYLVEEIRYNLPLSDVNDTLLQSDAFNRINSIQPMLLVLAIIFFRAIPFAIGLLTREIGDDLKDNTTNSMYTGIFDVVVVTIEFDSWFTLIQSMGDCSSDHIIPVWTLWVAMVIMYAAVATLSGIRGLFKNCDDKKVTDERIGIDLTCGIILIIAITVAFVFYLLSDNTQPLDCYPGSSAQSGSILRLIFVILSGVIYLVCFFTIIGCIVNKKGD